MNITQLEARLFPHGKRPSEMSRDDYARLSAELDTLVDQYGEERIAAMLRELTMLTGGQIRAMLDERQP
ncbi:MAG: hypothetical protein J2P17_17230 [Mycobacterium sp.]|nr:hypothetical protein [Mycobacterium sp.]